MLAPLAPPDWSLDHASHLLVRAGFGGTPDQIRALHQLGPDQAVESLLSASAPQLPPPDWTQEAAGTRKDIYLGMTASMSDLDRKERIKDFLQLEHQHLLGLRSWWLERMRQGRRPLLEKMTLFWHGHFATSFTKVKSAWLMWQQNETLRAYALGSFREMLRAMTRDAAMIRWLDLGKSKVGEPNENFAREVLELFTLGEGHYTEDDIKEGARAFTGHRIDPETMGFIFARKAHDYGPKKFLGRSGNFNADDAVDLILAQDQCARFVTKRLWEFLAYENPEPAVLDGAAATLREARYEMKPLLRTILRSQAFYSPRAMRTQIKSPVDWLVNSCVGLGCDLPAQPALDFMLTRLGQLPFAPPNVRGWEGGKSWISSSTLVLRYNLAGYLLGARDPETKRIANPRLRAPVDIRKVAPVSLRAQPDALADAMTFRLFGTPNLPRIRARAREAIAAAATPLSDSDAHDLSQKLMSTPDFQLT